MTEWFALLAGLAIVAIMLRHRSGSRDVRADLRAVIAAQPAAPVTDAGGAPVFALARALELDQADLPPSLPEPRPPRNSPQEAAWEAREMLRPLGLELVDMERAEPRSFSPGPVPRGRTEMAGTRHGRRVVVQLEEASSLVFVAGAMPSFTLSACSGRWIGLEGAPHVVASWLGGLEPTRRWDGVEVRCEAGGLSLERKQESTRSWMHDLWLAEQLADAALVRVPAAA